MKDTPFTAARLLSLYDQVAEADDAIPRLRRFVLDLAVRGKLVAQEASDEPAAELLKRIAKEKARLVKAGEIKQQKPLTPVDLHDLPFDLPIGWSVTRLADVAVCLDYMREPINGTERDKRIQGKQPEELYPYFGATQQQGWIDDYIFDEELILLGEDGIPFFDHFRSKAYLVAGKTWVNNHAHVFRGILISNQFYVHYLNVFDYSGRVVGATRAKLNQAQAIDIPVPLPPLVEQRRIVGRVEELMALCDQLQAARAGERAVRDRLTTATLSRLTDPDQPPEAAPQNARFALHSLPTLTTHPAQIKTLRQTILNLAVRGRLVMQDAADEPAAIAVKSLEPTQDFLPQNWCFVRLGRLLSEDTRNGYARKPDEASGGIPILRISAGTVRQDGIVAEEQFKLISGIDQATRSQYGLRSGDLLACRFNGNKFFVGRLTLFKDYLGTSPIYPDKLIRIRIASNLAVPEFVRLAGESDFVRRSIEEACATTVGNWGISSSNLKEVCFPLPPLAEQHRIVARVDALMALCDQLESSLTTATTTRSRLLESLLHEALN